MFISYVFRLTEIKMRVFHKREGQMLTLYVYFTKVSFRNDEYRLKYKATFLLKM